VGRCGNSGNSTEPHVHLQVTDSTSWPTARGLPISFCRPGGPVSGAGEDDWLPGESEIVDAGPS
jgi:murein DD-endopeptidase MepM/ murein hydrolase activator NlpD